jgi:hypothetical protein
MSNYNETEVPIGISNTYLQFLHLHNHKYVDVFAELIDNSISSCKKRSVIPEIKITLNSDAINIEDNGNGFSRIDLNTALIAADNTSSQVQNSELGVYGYGLKGSAFWLGQVLKISSVSCIDNSLHSLEFDIRKLPKGLSPTPTVKLTSSELNPEQIKKPTTIITISEIHSTNYQLNINPKFIAELKLCLGRIYAPRIEKSKIRIYINGELIDCTPRIYLESLYYQCFEKSGRDYLLKKECQKKDNETWRYDVSESLIDNASGKKYEIHGTIGMKPNQSTEETGIRVYLNDRGILGCNSRYSDFNPYGFQQGKPAQLWLIGDIYLNESFQKPIMGNALPEEGTLIELLKEFRIKHGRLFVQANEFRVAMLRPILGGPAPSVQPLKTNLTDDTLLGITSQTRRSVEYDLQNEMNVIHDELARPGFNNKTQSERWVYESPDLGFKIIFILDPESKINIQILDNSKDVHFNCDSVTFESRRIIGKLLEELFKSMNFENFKACISNLY